MNLVMLLIGFAVLYTLQLFVARSFFIKLLVITYLFLVSSAIYFSFNSFKGWPTDERIHKAYLLGVYIVQPTPSSEGAIYVWTLEENKEQNFIERWIGISSKDAPRAYFIPYSEKASQAFADAEKEMQKGMLVVLDGDMVESKSNGNEQSEGDKQNTTSGDGGAVNSGEEYDGPHISIVSPDQVMRK